MEVQESYVEYVKSHVDKRVLYKFKGHLGVQESCG